MNKYYVYKNRDAHIGWNDGCIVFWRAGGKGYSNYIEDAGVFTDDDKASGYPPSREEFVWVPVEVAREVMKTRSYVWQKDLPESLWKVSDDRIRAERAEEAQQERGALRKYAKERDDAA